MAEGPLIDRARRVVELTLAGEDQAALDLLDVVLFDLRPETPGLDELAYALLAIQVTLAERLQREEQVMAAGTAFLDRLTPGTSVSQRLAVAVTRLRRGRVAWVMGRPDQARTDVEQSLAELSALPHAELSGAQVTLAWLTGQRDDDAVVRRARLRIVHRRVHWLVQQGDLAAIAQLTPDLVTGLTSEADRECRVQLRDALVDIYGAYVAAEQPDAGLAVLDSLVVLLGASDDPVERGRATVLVAIKALLLRSVGRRDDSDAALGEFRRRVGPDTWTAQTEMLATSCALNAAVRAQQRAGSLLVEAMMLDELGRQTDADATLVAFADGFAPEVAAAVSPFVAIAEAARRALGAGGRIIDVVAGA